jgi:hypothetical protein
MRVFVTGGTATTGSTTTIPALLDLRKRVALPDRGR